MPTRRHGGFRLGRKLLSVWRWALCHRRRRRGRGYLRLQPFTGGNGSPATAALSAKKQQQQQQFVVPRATDPPRMLTWGRSLARHMRLLRRRGSTKHRLLEDAAEATTPKGQVAVYVGGAEPGESMRYVVPVVYFNHPLFGELLREAEEEFGFEHPGGITIPCATSRFERAAAEAAAGGGGKKVVWW
ncbi:auxin-responsive protein SAUR36-like [Phragmites australis]|uniref:auxin-responsive protein SAUR36-like n=1 Tax=Phragmites australis TaxID=29695 RepID=UPI002D784266|nr:auxin-responsive protein SAUR36-like [Phragmites australis]